MSLSYDNGWSARMLGARRTCPAFCIQADWYRGWDEADTRCAAEKIRQEGVGELVGQTHTGKLGRMDGEKVG